MDALTLHGPLKRLVAGGAAIVALPPGEMAGRIVGLRSRSAASIESPWITTAICSPPSCSAPPCSSAGSILSPARRWRRRRRTRRCSPSKRGRRHRPRPPELPREAACDFESVISRGSALKAGGARVAIATPSVNGSLRLKGARFDDLQLRKYRETLDPKSPEIVLFSPESTAFPYYHRVRLGGRAGIEHGVPDDTTPWTLAGGHVLTPQTPVTLRWDNGQGLTFTRTISVDKQYMFTVSDAVTNHGGSAAVSTRTPMSRAATSPQGTHYMALHEGFVGILGGDLQDPNYTDLKADKAEKTFHSTGGWLGITDKYWMAAIIPPQSEAIDAGVPRDQAGCEEGLPGQLSDGRRMWLRRGRRCR